MDYTSINFIKMVNTYLNNKVDESVISKLLTISDKSLIIGIISVHNLNIDIDDITRREFEAMIDNIVEFINKTNDDAISLIENMRSEITMLKLKNEQLRSKLLSDDKLDTVQNDEHELEYCHGCGIKHTPNRKSRQSEEEDDNDEAEDIPMLRNNKNYGSTMIKSNSKSDSSDTDSDTSDGLGEISYENTDSESGDNADYIS